MQRHVIMDEKLPMLFEIMPLPDEPMENEYQFASIVWERAVHVTKKTGDHPPLALFKSENVLVLVAMDFRPELKEQIVIRLHQAAHDFAAESFAMVMTMWFLDDPELTRQCMDYDLKPSQHTKRKEGLLIEVQTKTGEKLMIGEIIRGKNQEVVDIKEKEYKGALTVKSRFSGIITRGVA